MLEIKLAWQKKSDRLYDWNECPYCGYKSYNTVFGEEVKPGECPECGKEILKHEKPKPTVYRPSWYKQVDGCMAFFCQFGTKSKERCKTCGFNVNEHCRRMNLPWTVDENGIRHKNIGAIKPEDRL